MNKKVNLKTKISHSDARLHNNLIMHMQCDPLIESISLKKVVSPELNQHNQHFGCTVLLEKANIYSAFQKHCMTKENI